MLRGVLTTTRRRLIVALAGLGMLAPAAPAEGASFWTIRPDKRDLVVGLSPEGVVNPGGSVVWPVLAVPTAGALDQHWSFHRFRSGDGYQVRNRQSGKCLSADEPMGRKQAQVIVFSCTDTKQSRFNFHRPGASQPSKLLSSGTYQLRNFRRERGEEVYGRCLTVPHSFFEPGAKLATEPCSRAANQRFVLSRFSAP